MFFIVRNQNLYVDNFSNKSAQNKKGGLEVGDIEVLEYT